MSDLTTQVLIDIRTELREMRAENREMRDDIRGTNERLDRVVQEQIRQAVGIVTLENRLGNALEGLNARIDNVLIGSVGTAVKEHESRIRRLEQHVGLGPLEK